MYYGDLGKRILAAILDCIILTMIGAALGFMLNIVGVIIAPLVSWFYYILMEGGGWHATLGKRVMGLYIADSNGNGIKYSTAILRMIGKMLSALTLGIGYLMGFFSDEKQCLHDMIAKTYVLTGQPESAYRTPYKGTPEIVGINGPLAGMVYPVTENGVVIGRDSVSCQIVLPATQNKVSRVHCYVTYNPISDMFVLNDRNSTHGTYLCSGKQVWYSQPAALRRGDRFYLATNENIFEVR